MAIKKVSSVTIKPQHHAWELINPSGIIDAYDIIYSSNTFAPRIGLKRNNEYIASLVFEANGKVLAPDTVVGKLAMLHYHLDDFANVIDLLRNEAPLGLFYNGSGGGSENGLRTL